MRFPCRTVTTLMLASAACGQGITGPEPLLTDLPRPLTAAELHLVDAGNRFTFDLFRVATAALPPDSNAFLSPFSASMALGLALNGAGGETFDALREALRVDGVPLADINRGYRDLMSLLVGLDRTTDITVANSVWSDAGFPILPSFLDAARTWFDAEARSLDFRYAVSTINDWVNGKTRGRIPKLLDRIEQEEVAFLINAIHFKGRWRMAFDKARTRSEPFHAADGTTGTVQMMSLEPTPLRHVWRPEYQAVDLLYGNGAFSMTVLLPAEGRTPADLLTTLNHAAWRELTEAFEERKVGLSLPRFRMEYERSLKNDLTALGMGIAFDPNRADFYGIADVRPERLYLTRVIQKTFVDVNEEGTEAAAATAVGVGITSMPPVMVVDRPFLFVLRERFSGAILFIGQVNRL
jgi:serine protease inhibitor